MNHLFRCSSCDAPLVDLFCHTDVDLEWVMVAECCHCGGKSYQKKIKGMFNIGQTEESAKYTVVDSIEMDKLPIVIKTKKVKDYE